MKSPLNTTRHVAGIVALAAALAVALGTWLVFGNGLRAELAPDIAYTRLDGSQSSTDRWRGKVVLVNFWATSCEPCIREMPQIIAAHQLFKTRGYDTLAVAMRDDPPASVIHYAETRKLPFDVAIDNTGEIAKGYGGVDYTPTSLLIDRHGHIVKHYIGAPDFAALHQLVEKLLAET